MCPHKSHSRILASSQVLEVAVACNTRNPEIKQRAAHTGRRRTISVIGRPATPTAPARSYDPIIEKSKHEAIVDSGTGKPLATMLAFPSDNLAGVRSKRPKSHAHNVAK